MSHASLARLVKEIPPDAIKLTEKFWPGPLTLVLLKREEVPDIVTAGLPNVAVRMPDHPMALQLIQVAGCPIAAPVQILWLSQPTTAEHVRDQLDPNRFRP